MQDLYDYREQLIDHFRGIVGDLAALLGEVPPGAWHVPGKDGRTPHWMLSHLRAVEAQAYACRLRCILDQDTPQLALFDDLGWMTSHYDPEEPVQAILQDYARLRQEELSWLHGLPPQAWNRSARHPWWGVRTLQWWVEHCLADAQDHLERLQLEPSTAINKSVV